jgi:hypothetical protein
MTARSQAVAGSCADSAFAAEGLGDFSLHGSASSRLIRTPSLDAAAVAYAGAAGGGRQAAGGGDGSRIDEAGFVAAAAAAGHGGGGSTKGVEAGAVAAAAAAGLGSSAGLAVARKVSFAEAEPEVLG